MQIKAVLFDLDGTLIDTIPDLTYGLNQMLKGLDKPPLTTGQVSSMVGRGVIDLMENVFRASRLAVRSEAINKAISVYCDIMVRSGSSHSTVFPDVFESLARLRTSGMKVAIVTNKPRSMTEAIVREKARRLRGCSRRCRDRKTPSGNALVCLRQTRCAPKRGRHGRRQFQRCLGRTKRRDAGVPGDNRL